MEPLFNQNCELVGWMRLDEHIFDLDMNWVAYISNNHAWSAETGNWLGPIDVATCLDQNGKPLVWSPISDIRGTVRPIRPVRAVRSVRPVRPVRPVLPVRPVRPIAPVGGWSQLTWQQWLAQ